MTRNRSKQTGLALVAIIVMATSIASAEQAVELKLKYQENSKLEQSLETKMKQILTPGGMEIQTTVDQFGQMSFAAGRRDEQGRITVEQSFDLFQAWIKAPGLDYQFNSATPDKGGDDALATLMRTTYKAVISSKWLYVYDKDNKLIEVKLKDKDTVKDVDPSYKEMFEPDYWMQQRNNETQVLPDTPVKPGDTWKRSTLIGLGSGQSMTFSLEYTYVGTVEKEGRSLHRITGKATSVKYEMAADSPSPLKLKNSDLKVAESATEVLFDSKAGVIVSSISKLRIAGEINFTAGEQELPGKLDLTMEGKVTER